MKNLSTMMVIEPSLFLMICLPDKKFTKGIELPDGKRLKCSLALLLKFSMVLIAKNVLVHAKLFGIILEW